MESILRMRVLGRTVCIWLAFKLMLWFTFGLGFIINKAEWINVIQVQASSAAEGGWVSTLFFIIGSNLVICLLIAGGNIFVRFGSISPGLIILFIQAASIGWLAGSNGFEIPFESLRQANFQYLRVGFWETSAYALVCAVTLPKSLYVSKTFPAKKWSEIRGFKDLTLNKTEFILLIASGVAITGAAIIETIWIFN